MLFANRLQPGADLALPLPDNDAATILKTGGLNRREFIAHVFPSSFFQAMATNEILQILGCAALLLPAAASARYLSEREAKALTGVLKRIKDAGAVRIGYRQAAIPLSFEGPDGRPYGCAIDLCHEVVDELADAAGIARAALDLQQVVPAAAAFGHPARAADERRTAAVVRDPGPAAGTASAATAAIGR
jgi:hypothetical protein